MDTFDYQRSSVPARLPTQRGALIPAPRLEGNSTENLPSPISVRAVLRASRRYWWLILALWVVGMATLGPLIYLKVRPVYSATSLLRVDPTVIDLYGGANREGNEPYMQTHVELIKSQSVLSSVAADKRVMELPRIKYAGDAIQELTKIIQVRILPHTHLIEVSMFSPSPEEAALLVNAVVESFLYENRIWSNGSTKTQIQLYTDHYNTLQKDIRSDEDKIRVLAARGAKEPRVVVREASDPNAPQDKPATGKWDVDHYQKLLSASMDVKILLIAAQSRLQTARALAEEYMKENALAGAKPSGSNKATLERLVDNDPEVRELSREYRAAWDKLNKARTTARQSHDPAIVIATTKCREIDARMKTLRQQKIEAHQEDPNSDLTVATPDGEIHKAEIEVRDLTARRDALEHELGTLKLETYKQNSEDLDRQFVEQEHTILVQNAEIVHKKLEQLRMDQANNERIRKISEARAEGRPISDKRKQYLAVAPVGVLAVVIGLALLLEIRSGRVADTEVLSSRMRHEVFSIAPLPSVRTGLALGGSDRAEQRLARFVQSLDHLRVALCEGGTNGEGRCVMITSATGGEGKTTLSAHLAARCANAGTSTLLIDADLRRASLGRLLDVPSGPGLGDVLSGQAELDGPLITAQPGGFHFLSAGTPGIDPTRVLRSTRLAELIGQLRQMYDLIIIDTPPVLPVADALILGRWADGAVMAARYDASRLPMVERANRQVVAAGIPVLGVVVNGVKGHEQTYGNYAYSYSYPGRRETLNETDATS